jgi:hypothetical protein
MEHPVQYLTVVTKFLDRIIEEHGDRLFMVLVFVCLGVIAWILVRRRKRPVYDFPVAILPLGTPPKHDADSEPVAFRDNEGF